MNLRLTRQAPQSVGVIGKSYAELERLRALGGPPPHLQPHVLVLQDPLQRHGQRMGIPAGQPTGQTISNQLSSQLRPFLFSIC